MLKRLVSALESILDNTELIDALATIKFKSKEINQKLIEAKDKKIQINEEIEHFRPFKYIKHIKTEAPLENPKRSRIEI